MRFLCTQIRKRQIISVVSSFSSVERQNISVEQRNNTDDLKIDAYLLTMEAV